MDNINEIIKQIPRERSMFQSWFNDIANCLMLNYVIATRHQKYRILEVEFYYYNTIHPDKSTYGYMDINKKYCERIVNFKKKQWEGLTWMIHYSGIDIVIGRENEPGGILLRKIKNINSKQEYVGPLVLLMELLNQEVNAEDGSFSLKLERNNNVNSRYRMGDSEPRIGIGANSEGFEKCKYNFRLIKNEVVNI